jgi:hypothetical protein
MAITEAMIREAGENALVDTTVSPDNATSVAALWMLLLLRLTAVAGDPRLELRNST